MQLWPIPLQAAVAGGIVFVVALLVLLVWLVRRRRLGPPPAAELPAPLEAPPPPPAPRLRGALAKTRDTLRQRLAEVFGRNRELDAILGSLEEALLSADVGVKSTARILERVRARSAADGKPDET